MVLGIASQVRVDMVKSFVRYQRPSQKSSHLPSLVVLKADIAEYLEQLLPHDTKQENEVGRP